MFPVSEPILESLGIYYAPLSPFVYVGGSLGELAIVLDRRFYLVRIECHIRISTAFPDILIHQS